MSNDYPDQHNSEDEMLPEYDFSGGIRGKHAAAMKHGYSVTVHKADGTTEVREHAFPVGTIVLDPDVRPYFPDAEAVNTALRGLIQLIPRLAASGEPS